MNGVVEVKDVSYNWYSGSSGTDGQTQIQIKDYKGRLYVDNEGSLHFTYLELSDQLIFQPEKAFLRGSGFYQCGVGSYDSGSITMTGSTDLTVDPITGGMFLFFHYCQD